MCLIYLKINIAKNSQMIKTETCFFFFSDQSLLLLIQQIPLEQWAAITPRDTDFIIFACFMRKIIFSKVNPLITNGEISLVAVFEIW